MPSEWDNLTLGKLWVLLDTSEDSPEKATEKVTYSGAMQKLAAWRKENVKPEDIPDHIDKKKFYDGIKQPNR